MPLHGGGVAGGDERHILGAGIRSMSRAPLPPPPDRGYIMSDTTVSGYPQQWTARPREDWSDAYNRAIGLPTDASDMKHEQHASQERQSLLKRLPAFKQDWEPEVQIAWFEMVAKLWTSA